MILTPYGHRVLLQHVEELDAHLVGIERTGIALPQARMLVARIKGMVEASAEMFEAPADVVDQQMEVAP